MAEINAISPLKDNSPTTPPPKVIKKFVLVRRGESVETGHCSAIPARTSPVNSYDPRFKFMPVAGPVPIQDRDSSAMMQASYNTNTVSLLEGLNARLTNLQNQVNAQANPQNVVNRSRFTQHDGQNNHTMAGSHHARHGRDVTPPLLVE